MAPARASELVEMTRDYGTVQGLYSSLLSKMEESKLAAEGSSAGSPTKQFGCSISTRLPEKPFKPNPDSSTSAARSPTLASVSCS